MVGVSHRDGETSLSRSQRHIVAILTAAGPGGISSASFAEELYGEDLTPSWEASTRQAISRMRKALGIGTIVTHNGRYALNLPTVEVDVWKLLRAHEIDLGTEPESVLQQLLAGEPFADVESSPLLRHQLEPITVARAQLIERMADHHARVWSSNTMLLTRTLAARSHYQDNLLIAVLRLHLSAGLHAHAADLTTKATAFLRDELDAEISPQITAMLDGPTARSEAPDVAAASPSGPPEGRIVGIFDTTTDLGVVHRSELENEIERSLDQRGALLDGDSGSGKSALVKALVLRLARTGHHILWLTGRSGAPTAYEPFVSALPSLEEELAPLLGDGGDVLQRSQCWSATRRKLAAEFRDLPLVIVVDDAHLIDSHSQRLVVFLASTFGPDIPRLIVMGREDPAAPSWNQFADELVRAGLHRTEVGVFDTAELLTLIGLHHPLSASKQRHDFAASLYAGRASLPAVAHELIQSADPTTLAVVDPQPGSARSDLWARRVGPNTQRIAAIAAVLGMRFRVGPLGTLSGIDVETIVEATDELLDARILVAEQRPDEFSFRHVLIHADFDSVLNRGERRRLHLDAATASAQASDIHAHATHMVEAAALLDQAHVVQAILASAREFRAQGSHREAVEAFAQARQLAYHELSAADLLSYASSVASSGGDGWELRSTAFELSLADSDTNLGLEIALTDVLKTEDAMGDPRRVDMLERLDAQVLEPQQQTLRSAALARELGLLGFHERAIDTTHAAIAAAANPADRLRSWFGGWAACRALPPTRWPELPADRHDVVDDELVSRLAQIECAQALVLGNDSAARSALEAFTHHPFTKTDPLRSWHGALVNTMLAFVDARWDDHQRLADDTFATASSQGVIAAFSTRVAQEFGRHWVLGTHGTLLPQLEAAPPDIQDSFLARAAFAATLAEHDEHRDEATAQITRLAQEITLRRSPFSHPAATLLASVPTTCLIGETRNLLCQAIEPFRCTAIVVGASISHLGPASLTLARLTPSEPDKAALVRQACDEADRWNLRLWSVMCRLELADVEDSAELRSAARSLAAGSSLEGLV